MKGNNVNELNILKKLTSILGKILGKEIVLKKCTELNNLFIGISTRSMGGLEEEYYIVVWETSGHPQDTLLQFSHQDRAFLETAYNDAINSNLDSNGLDVWVTKHNLNPHFHGC